MSAELPQLAVIVPTYRREEVLIETLHSLLQCDYPADRWQLLVVDQTAEHQPEVEKELAHLAKNGKIHWFHPPEVSFASLTKARNYGMSKAPDAALYLFVDDDVEVGADFFHQHVTTYEDPHIGAVAGRITVPGHQYIPNPAVTGKVSWMGKFIDNFHREEDIDTDNFVGCNFSIRATVAKKAGLFDEHFIGNAMREDTDMAMRVRESGQRIRFRAAAYCLHKMTASGGTRSAASKLEWYHALFFNHFLFYGKHAPSWRMPFFVLHMLRPILVCWLYYGHGSVQSFMTAYTGIQNGYRAGKASSFRPNHIQKRIF